DAPRTTVLLRDAHGAITTSGTTTAGIPPGSWRTAVEAALRGRAIAFLSTAELVTPGLVLRGGAETGDAVAVPEFPVATVVESDRPRFRWAAPPGGVVRVAVYTPDTQRVVQSGWMQATAWQAPASLPRGTTLVWQVESRTAEEAADGRVSAPARFRVLSSAEAARLVTARATGSHLVLGTVAAELGQLDLAAAEFRRLRALNPDSPLAVALHEQALRAQRAAPTATKEAQKNG
ncbi:MAG TPA: hypothetical protein VE010_18330, partial [Thermoanaerobaculia bacterium]|nr:hypothetical protein [Thermoanaerobaculia bacterium]